MKLIKKIKRRIKKMENSRKDKLESDFLILMLLAAAAVAVFAIMVDTTKKPQAVPRQPTAKEMTKEEKVAIQEKVAGFVASANLDGCEEVRGVFIDGIDYYKVCVNNAAKKIALENLDLSYCDRLDGELMSVDECKAQVASLQADISGNASSCESVTDKIARLSCQMSFWTKKAEEENNVSICSNLLNEASQARCKDSVMQKLLLLDPGKTDCADFSSDYYQSDCNTFKKAIKGSADECLLIGDIFLSNKCFDNFIK